MSNPQTHPMKRFLLWLSGAPASPSTAPPPAQAPTAEAVELAVAAPVEATAIADKGMPGDGLPTAVASTAVASATTTDAAATETLNDATAYGVAVVPADLPAGTPYWRAVLVHHLTPDENHANHHIFLDALDEQGARITGARGRVTWEGGEQVVTVDKPANEPGTNFPMWKWQVCSAEMLELPSDRVTGLHTGHPDEPPGTGNTLFHHSFLVHFQRAIQDAQPGPGPQQPPGSVISGTVSGAAEHALLLTMDGEIVAQQMLALTGVYRFEGLAAGEYVLVVEGSGVHSDVIPVDGQTTITIDLTVPTGDGEKFIDRYFLFGPSSSARTAVYLDLARSYLLSHQPTFGFHAEEASHSQHVVLMGGLQDIPQATEDALLLAGCQVQRISGTPQQIQDALRLLDNGGNQVVPPTVQGKSGNG